MGRRKKTEEQEVLVENQNISEVELTDEYFINLTMDYDKRDDNIYPKWAVWCAKSNDRYYIDGKDGHFYTHERTLDEIDIEKKKRAINDMLFSQDHDDSEEELWQRYNTYIFNILMDDQRIRTIVPKTFEQWKEDHKEE